MSKDGDLASGSSEVTTTGLVDLPVEILGWIFLSLEDVTAVVSLTSTCRMLRELAASLPFSLNLRCRHDHDGTSCRAWTRNALQSLRSAIPCSRFLDLSGTWIVDEDVVGVLRDFKRLDCLVLDRCQKLTDCVADALVEAGRSCLQTVSLQRCFGLGPVTAGHLIMAAARNSYLQCIMFSHLNNLEIPGNPSMVNTKEGKCTENLFPDKRTLNIYSGSSLHMLALNNCLCIGAKELASLAFACPHLEALMLGGSVQGLRLSKHENLPQETVLFAAAALSSLVEKLSELQILELTFFPTGVIDLVREANPNLKVWDFSEKSSLSCALSYLKNFKCTVLPRCGTAYPSNPIHPLLTSSKKQIDVGKKYHSNNGINSTRMSTNEERKLQAHRSNIYLAVQAAINCSDNKRRTPLHFASASGDIDSVRILLAFGAETRGLKDTGGATALFTAAESGYGSICELLLESGAEPLVSNRAGENPLYIAALRGHCAVVEVLVRYCTKRSICWWKAEVYGDGWTPLMAAVVGNRQSVAKILLKAVGINLTSIDETLSCMSDICLAEDKSNFGNQRDRCISWIGKIMEAAQSSLTVAKTCTGQEHYNIIRTELLDAQNKYGQTALHIAARKASIWFVCILLFSGSSIGVRDSYMMCAIDIARQFNHQLVVEILKHWDALWRKDRMPTPRNIPKLNDNDNQYHVEKNKFQKSNKSRGSRVSSQDDGRNRYYHWRVKNRITSKTQ